jgi:polysaccharide biosynthesis protein PslH
VTTDAARELSATESLRSLCHRVEAVPLKRSKALRSCARAVLRGEPLQAAYCQSEPFTQRMRTLLEEGRFDIVHIEHLRAAHLGALIPPSLPTLYDSVDCISLLLERTLRSSHSPRQRAIAALELMRTRAYEARLVRSFDRVIATSPDDAFALTSLAPGAQVSVVQNGVDLAYFKPASGPVEPATLVFSGKMSYHANATAILHFVQQTLPLIKAVRPDVRLRVVGSSPSQPVRDLARNPAISVTGFLPDIRQAVASATVAICPVTVKVGIQNKVLEAMAMGLPVVSTAGGISGLSVLPERDLLVGETPREFAAQVCRLLADTNLRNRLGRAARAYVETHHRWDVAAQKLETLYAEAITHHGMARPDTAAFACAEPHARTRSK